MICHLRKAGPPWSGPAVATEEEVTVVTIDNILTEIIIAEEVDIMIKDEDTTEITTDKAIKWIEMVGTEEMTMIIEITIKIKKIRL